jgi:hypothetical protein
MDTIDEAVLSVAVFEPRGNRGLNRKLTNCCRHCIPGKVGHLQAQCVERRAKEQAVAQERRRCEDRN